MRWGVDLCLPGVFIALQRSKQRRFYLLPILRLHTLIVGCEPAKIITGEDDTDFEDAKHVRIDRPVLGSSRYQALSTYSLNVMEQERLQGNGKLCPVCRV